MKEMIKYANIECISYTYDEGRTEIPKGSLTTIAFIPMPKDDNRITGYIAELKLL
jgi:peptidyl-tRNA hydrolase